MEVVIDASVLIAVITNEDEKEKLVAMTSEAESRRRFDGRSWPL